MGLPSAALRRAPRPREDPAAERLLERGAASLEEEALLRLVLGAGTAVLAHRILEEAGGLFSLAQAPLAAAGRAPGLTRARLVRLLAALELGRRALAPPEPEPPVVGDPAGAAAWITARYGNAAVEEFGALALDVRGRLIRSRILARGSPDAVRIHPREVLAFGVEWRADSLVLFHNHPSGNPAPSRFDRALTRRLRSAGDIVGIPVVDHLIVGAAGSYYSFLEAKDF